jgi:hypothetical protein
MMIGDGPVTEQTVQIAGFNILECGSLAAVGKTARARRQRTGTRSRALA